jgi:glycosyltransferase involved in cell wall biosynthesis
MSGYCSSSSTDGTSAHSAIELADVRILYLTRESHPSFRPDIAVLFGKHLPRLGIASDIVALTAPGAESHWGGGRTFLRAVGRNAITRLWQRLRLGMDLFWLSRRGYDAIQVRDETFNALVGLIVARLRRQAFYYWMSFPFAEVWLDLATGREASSAGWLRRFYWLLKGAFAEVLIYRVILPRADHVFVQSEAMADALVARGLPRHRMTPVPMGVAAPDAGEIERYRAEEKADPRLAKRRVVVYLGALERLRRPELMIEAMATVKVRFPDALLVLVGDSQNPGERQWLDEAISRLGLSGHVLLTGWLPTEQAHRYLLSAEVALSPIPRSRAFDVGSPTKIAEYLAYGLPVVANDQPDQAQLLRLGGGMCVPLTAAGFAHGIIQLLGDPQLAARMAAAGREQVLQLRSYHVLATGLAGRYRDLCPAQTNEQVLL